MRRLCNREFGMSPPLLMRYDTHFESLAKTEGFLGFDAAPEHNDVASIESVLTRSRGIWMQPLGPGHGDLINRLRGKVGMVFAVNGADRRDAIHKARDFLGLLSDPTSAERRGA